MLIGPIVRRHALWQRFWPILTQEHAVWATLTATIVFCVSGFLTQWRIDAQIVITACSLIGTLPAFASNLPALMQIEWSALELDPESLVNDALESAGWSKTRLSPREVLYVQKAPRFLRWETGNIILLRSQGSITLYGPVFGLLLCRRHLPKAGDA